MNEEEAINLGDKIQLVGFKDLKPGELHIIKKLIGTQVRRFQELVPDFERLKLRIKIIHSNEINNNSEFELKSELIHGGKPINAEVTCRNIFTAISKVLNKIESAISK